MIRILQAEDPAVKQLFAKRIQDYDAFEKPVSEILQSVKTGGDAAVFAATAKFDGAEITKENFAVSAAEIEEAYAAVDTECLQSIRLALENIRAFHQKQLNKSWMEPDASGSILGQIYRPLERVGVYVPGGTAPLFSSVLMNVVPAAVAGVPEIVMVSPPGKDGKLNPYVLVAAAEAGATEIYKAGGVQAIAALAFGTESIRKVDKITGPGNIYVTLAKKMVYGSVDIDMLAGPSEILIVADASAAPDKLAADMLSQAEHDKLAAAILVTDAADMAEDIAKEVERQLAELPRREIAASSLANYGAIVLAKDLDAALDVANAFAQDHMELCVADPFALLGKVKNAGAIFMGHNTPEPMGDYWAGPNHILPTGGTARFYSPVTVDTFVKKSSVIYITDERLQAEGAHVVRMAEKEGLDAHANSVRIRLKK